MQPRLYLAPSLQRLSAGWILCCKNRLALRAGKICWAPGVERSCSLLEQNDDERVTCHCREQLGRQVHCESEQSLLQRCQVPVPDPAVGRQDEGGPGRAPE